MAKSKTSPLMVIAVVALVLILGFLVYSNYSQTVIGGGAGSSEGGCNIAPSVSVLATNTLVSGTTPSLSANYSIYDGAYVGSIPTSLSKGASLDVLGTASNYLNAEYKLSSIGCGNNALKFALTPYSAPSISVRNDASGTLATATLNESSSANQIIDTVKLSGTPDKSTGDMLVIVEFSNKTQVASSGIDLSGATRVNTPDWYNPSSISASVVSFEVPAIVDGGSNPYDLTFTPESGQTIGSTASKVTVTAYTLNPVILDSNTGKFLTSSTWQDSLGADQTIASVNSAYYIA